MSLHRLETGRSPVATSLRVLLARARGNVHAIRWCGLLAWWRGATPGRHAAGRTGSVRFRSTLPPATAHREPFSVLRAIWDREAMTAHSGDYRWTSLRMPPYLTR